MWETFARENFCELVENKTFVEKTFVDFSLVPPKDTTPPNFAERTFPNRYKTLELFSLKSFPLYGIHTCMHSKESCSLETFFSPKLQDKIQNEKPGFEAG